MNIPTFHGMRGEDKSGGCLAFHVVMIPHALVG